MKRFTISIFIILLFIFSKNATAQFESIFGQETTKWDVLIGACDSWCSTSYTTIGDTIINAKSYQIISDSSGFQTIFLREDTTLGKVWSYESDLNSEQLLMDLTLSVGDSFSIFDDFTNQTASYPVDSVFYANGKKHIRIANFGNLCSHELFPLIFIEGVGTSRGLTYRYGSYKYQLLLCYTQNSITNHFYDDDNIYPGFLSIDTCDYCVSSVHELSSSVDYKIYPNPATNYLNIDLERPEELIDIKVYNLFGQLIEISQKTRLDVSTYPKVFLVKVVTESGIVVEKILRQ